MNERVIDLPKLNSDYKDVNYWNARYQDEAEKDWLMSYENLEDSLNHHVLKSDKILILGCGNSLLSEMMYKNGFLNITNIDYSSVVIEKMKNHCKNCQKLRWLTMDAQKLEFPDEEFEVVIEKATVDSFLVGHKDQWNIPRETKTFIERVLSEVSRVLKDGGRFLSISFSQPHFRGALYASPNYKWSFSKKELGTHFHYYFYIMTKGEELRESQVFSYKPPTITMTENHQHVSEPEDNFLFNMNHD